jgi:hypothetical protein
LSNVALEARHSKRRKLDSAIEDVEKDANDGLDNSMDVDTQAESQTAPRTPRQRYLRAQRPSAGTSDPSPSSTPLKGSIEVLQDTNATSLAVDASSATLKPKKTSSTVVPCIAVIQPQKDPPKDTPTHWIDA